MAELFALNQEYSTTRLVTREVPIIEEPPDATFKTVLFLPEGEERKGEGGLRTQGYFKRSLPEKPLVTVITVVFNGAEHLEKTILSVIGQTYDNVEYIIIDGGSSDRTLDIIRKYENAIDYWVSEKDKGIYHAWNKAVSVSQGMWISFLGSDDVYLPEALEAYSYIFNCTMEIGYVSSLVKLIKNEKYRTIGKEWRWEDFRKKMTVAHVGSLHAMKLFKKSGLFNEKIKIAGDYEFLLRFQDQLKSAHIDHVTAIMRTGGISNSCYKVFLETLVIKKKYTNRPFLIIGLETIKEYLFWITKKYLLKKI